jgi:hypothetical protein
VPRGRPQIPVEDRFWDKVVEATGPSPNGWTGCWLWTACINGHGYGKIKANRRDVGAHRLAYEMVVGVIPDGFEIDHLCRRRHCVNPAHLEPVRPRINKLRGVGITAIHARKTHCIRGHEFAEENTYYLPGRRGRQCRACNRIHDRNRKQPITIGESDGDGNEGT